MKFMLFSIFFVFFFIVIKSDSLHLNLMDEMQYGNILNDRNNILTVNPDDVLNPTVSSKKSLETNANYLDPEFKQVLNDISENSKFLAPESNEEAQILNNQNLLKYNKNMEEMVENTMKEIHEESREENLSRRNNAGNSWNQDENSYTSNYDMGDKKNYLKNTRFLQRNNDIYDDGSNMYDPSEIKI